MSIHPFTAIVYALLRGQVATTFDNQVTGAHRMTPTDMTNPGHIVTVSDFSAETLRRIIAHLEVSTEFEHMVYREAELDAIWSITAFFLLNKEDSDQRDLAQRLHTAAHEAHDLVADGRAVDAARLLQRFLTSDGERNVVP